MHTNRLPTLEVSGEAGFKASWLIGSKYPCLQCVVVDFCIECKQVFMYFHT